MCLTANIRTTYRLVIELIPVKVASLSRKIQNLGRNHEMKLMSSADKKTPNIKLFMLMKSKSQKPPLQKRNRGPIRFVVTKKTSDFFQRSPVLFHPSHSNSSLALSDIRRQRIGRVMPEDK